MSDKFQLKAILSAVDKMSPTLKTVAQQAKSTRKYLLDVGTATGNLSSSLALPALGAGLLGGLSAVEVKNEVVGFTEYAEEVKKAAMATGMTTDEVQRLKYVAKQSGVSFESLTDGVGKLNKNLAEVATGGAPELAGLLRHLGVATRDANGHLRGGAEMLPALADAFKRNTNPILQARMGMAAFGKSWKEILPLLMEGSDGMAKSYARFKQIGNLTSQADLDAAKEFGDQLSDVQMVTRGFGFTIAKELIPTLRPLVEDFIQWGAANKKLIAAQVKQFVVELVAGLKSFNWKGFFESIRSIVSGIGSFVDMIGGAKNALILLAVVMNANTIMAVIGLAGSIARLVMFVGGLSAPVLLAVAAFSALAMAGVWVYRNWSQIGPVFNDIFGGVIESVQDFISVAKQMFGDLFVVVKQLASLLAPVIVPVFKFIGWIIGGTILFALKAVTGLVGLLVDGLKVAAAIIGIVAKGVGSAIGVVSDVVGVGGASGNSVSPNAVSPVLAATQRVGGEINVNFSNAPPGMRVEQTSAKGGVDMNTSVGYRSRALGMP